MSLRIAPLPRSELEAARTLLKLACPFDEAHLVAEEKLFGDGAMDRKAQPLAAYEGDLLVAVACISDRWIRLLAVHPEHREKGVGSALLEECCHNYLSPGIDRRNRQTIEWLSKRGFSESGSACNLFIDLRNNDRVSEEHYEQRKARAEAAGYDIRRLVPSEMERCAALVEKHFSRGWAFELRRAAQNQPAGVHLALIEGEVVAFAAHDGNNQGLGSFGPTGTLEEHRGKGLGAVLLLACLLDIQRERSRAEVAWIGPREFYDKIAGIESERNFTAMTRELKEDER
jgi:GNAT superfamily N-acetyltransferase